MRCAHRLPQRLIRWTSLFVSLTLLLSVLAIIPSRASKKHPRVRTGSGSDRALTPPSGQRQPAPRNGGKKVDPAPPERGAPAVALPNLDEARQRKPEKPRAPAPIPSTMRSRHKGGTPKEKKAGNTPADATKLNASGLANRVNSSDRAQRTQLHSHHARDVVSSRLSMALPAGFPQAGGPTISNAGFELPSVGAGNFQYNPSGGSWTFIGAGVSGNVSGFTSGNPGAPEGNQVAFLQAGGSYISQAISGFQANTNYTITFAAAQRGNCCGFAGQDFQVFLDDSLLGTFRPGSTNYADYSTDAILTTAGAHTLKFYGLNSSGGRQHRIHRQCAHHRRRAHSSSAQ